MPFDTTQFHRQRDMRRKQHASEHCPNCGPERQRLVYEDGNLCCWTCDEVVRYRPMSADERGFYGGETDG